jgi:hypothetical protein
MDERERRIGLNETLFREVNERVRGINDSFGERLEEAQFVCECGDETCMERVRLPVADYERVRSDAELFVVKPGHEIGDVEVVVERHEGWDVVKKRSGEPAELARERDPRS